MDILTLVQVMSDDVFSHTRPPRAKLKAGPGYEATHWSAWESGVADPLPKKRGNAAMDTRLLKRKAMMAMAALIEQDVNKPHSISSTLKVLFPRIPGEWYHSGI